MTPRRLAEAAGELVCTAATASAVTLEVWDEDRIAAERLGGLLGVARGSVEPPRLLRMGYEPADPLRVDGHVPHVVLVGKGITFDSGGLSLKSADGMLTMKTDMSGAATVLATVSACADLGVRVRVTAIVPVTENMPGGSAIKPGDVLIARDGQTIEVLNTDAEGRLVLADGLSLAVELHPDAIVDLATLTGAAVVALGRSIAALFGNDRALVDRVKEAAGRAGEPVWQLPLAREYRSHIESDVADMKNIGKAEQAGSIAAALLLERFVGGIPWVHIDMAGPARSDEDNEVFTKGGTGFGVRTLLELLEAYGDASSG
jgi:leucyl aminopeptidase